MRTIIKLCICLMMIFSFTACYPVRVVDNDGMRHNRYEHRHEYRDHRREGGEVRVRINAEGNHDRHEDHD